MTLPDRKYSSGEGYRFGFQGQETDDEVNGDGNSVYFKYRVHDPRIGRFASIDPLAPKYPWNSPYAFSENEVIQYVELEGLEKAPSESGSHEGEKQTTSKVFEIQDTHDPTVSSSATVYKDWYWHEGSEVEKKILGYKYKKKVKAGWYGARKYKKILTGTEWGANNIPSNIRTLFSDAVLKREKTITEKYLTVDELVALRNVVKRALARDSDRIEYIDYATTTNGDQYSDVAGNRSGTGYGTDYKVSDKLADPYYALKTTLGQASIVKQDGNYYVIDSYDFNDAEETRSGKNQIQIFKSFMAGAQQANQAESGGKKVYSHSRNIGTHYGSKDGEGIPIEIKIKFLDDE